MTRLLSSAILAMLLFPALAFFPTLASAQGPKLPDGVVAERDVEYATVGERKLHVDIVHTSAKSDKPKPILVFIHGGGWRGGDKSGGISLLAPLVSTGKYVGFSVEYRFSQEAIWPAQIYDCKAAIRWIRANAAKYGGDPEKIGVAGPSAGGHLVSLLGTSGDVADLEGTEGTPNVSSRVQCVVDICGPSDFPAFQGENPGGGAIPALLGGTLADKHDAAVAASPVTYVTKDDPPFLILHGDKDPLVPYDQAERLDKKLKEAGVSTTLVKVEGGGHGIGGPAMNERIVAFFAKNLLDEKVDVSGDPIPQK